MAGATDGASATVSVDSWNIVLHSNFHDAHATIGIDLMFRTIKLNKLNDWHYITLI
jgi:hypothetical protein